MFAEELKTFRRLGFRHVNLFLFWFRAFIDHNMLGSPPSPQFCLGDYERSHDLERTWFDNKYRKSNSCCAQVCSPRQI